MIDWLKGANPASVADDDPRLMIYSGGIILDRCRHSVSGGLDPLNQNGLPNGKDQSMLDVEAGPLYLYNQPFQKLILL